MTTMWPVGVSAETEVAGLHGAADIWLLAESAVAGLATVLDAELLLTEEERRRRDRLVRPDSRLRFLGARMLTRYALSRYAGLPPDRWRFGAGPYGRPEIVGGNRWALDFNVSHTDGLIACVVSRYRRTGVDTERWPARPEAVRLAGKVLTAREQAHLGGLDEGARRRTFSGYWVLKEAYTKALGLGLQRRFDSFEVYDSPAGVPVLSDPTLGPGGGLWQLGLLDVPPAHLLGVAVRRGEAEPPIRLRIRDAGRELMLPGDPRITGPAIRAERLSGLTGLGIV
ncbi:4'-phosphopantetheinyl transferase [Actinoplanes octamycinicus]|uniref:4'-phosphopantetheinyl transferase n=1 Tax=Actinoplanes octamycinicus TaxID=135948 RepID=A0A7W7M6S4_9ACTN|nr:4'-phosphopantetheinyl transferase superfamily protein [Actinoplanes octamycinicus]MBB4739142.1 4'-phosphopantetheinyl transferase [Actinoplanes octamycinicus]GIE58883.1 hypothetical protein Aoc01nite_42850 [Actinoplanes octamycinicus]